MKCLLILGLSFIGYNVAAQFFSQGLITSSGAGSQDVIGFRLRALRGPGQSASGDKEAWLGVTDMGSVATNRAFQADYTWSNATNGVWFFSLSYNPSTDELSYTLSKTSGGTFTSTQTQGSFVNFATTRGKTNTAINNLNYMKLRLRNANSASSTTLDNLVLNGTTLNSSSITVNTAGADDNWSVTNYNFATAWTLTGKLTLSGNYNTSVEGNSFDVTVGYSVIPIPLHFGSINTQYINNHQLITWETLYEHKVSHFEIEGSYNGTLFEKLGEVKAVGNSNLTQQYKFISLQQYQYYRLKQVDINNQFTYSNVIKIYNHFYDHSIKLLTNPIADNRLILQLPNDGILLVNIVDALGKSIYTKKNSVGNTSILLPNVSKGLYYVVVTDGNTIIKTMPFIFQ